MVQGNAIYIPQYQHVCFFVGDTGKKDLDLKKETSNLLFPVSCIYLITNYFTMPQLINYGNEMLRISSKGIEYSTTNGRSWNKRYSGSVYGDFIDLLPYGNELLAVTTKGVYYSTTGGRSWNSRYTGSVYGTFNSLVDGGRELLANTSKGLYYSTSCGRSWNRRR